MKQLKRGIVLAVLTLAPHKDMKATLINTPGNLEWGKRYSVEFEQSYGDDLVYQQHIFICKLDRAVCQCIAELLLHMKIQYENLQYENSWKFHNAIRGKICYNKVIIYIIREAEDDKH